MPWDPIQLNDGMYCQLRRLSAQPILRDLGRDIPSIAFGTWTLGKGQGIIDQVDQAISIGFSHIGNSPRAAQERPTDQCNWADTAQSYRNEEEAGRAVRESGLARKEVFITTKYSGLDGLDIETSIHNSLKNVRCPFLSPLLIAFGMFTTHACLPSYSLALNTWTCTSSTTRGSRSRIFRLHGLRWKPSSERVSPSKPGEREEERPHFTAPAHRDALFGSSRS